MTYFPSEEEIREYYGATFGARFVVRADDTAYVTYEAPSNDPAGSVYVRCPGIGNVDNVVVDALYDPDSDLAGWGGDDLSRTVEDARRYGQ